MLFEGFRNKAKKSLASSFENLLRVSDCVGCKHIDYSSFEYHCLEDIAAEYIKAAMARLKKANKA